MKSAVILPFTNTSLIHVEKPIAMCSVYVHGLLKFKKYLCILVDHWHCHFTVNFPDNI